MMEAVGKTFPKFASQYGLDKTVNLLGRNFRDFVTNLDNLHDYLKFKFPRLKPPSFFVEDESDRSKLKYMFSTKATKIDKIFI